MSIALIESELRAALTALNVLQWPTRWPNEPWPTGIEVAPGNLPVDVNGAPIPCMLAEDITGDDTSAIGQGVAQGGAGRLSTRLGTLRVYLLVGQNTGATLIQTQADNIALGFKRQTIYADPPTWARLTTMDPHVDAPDPNVETGDRYVRMVTVPWIFEYRN